MSGKVTIEQLLAKEYDAFCAYAREQKWPRWTDVELVKARTTTSEITALIEKTFIDKGMDSKLFGEYVLRELELLKLANAGDAEIAAFKPTPEQIQHVSKCYDRIAKLIEYGRKK